MSKLTQALIPGYGANPTKPSSNPLSGLAPNLENGLPQGLPSGVGKIALRASNPVGGIAPDVNGDIGYQKGWLDQSSNGTPDTKQTTTTGPRTVWGDPDITKRGWGWGMDSNGQLQQGVVGGGPAGSIFGPAGGSTQGVPGAMPNASPSAMNPQQGMALAQRMRSMQNPQAGQLGTGMPQQGGALGAGGPAPTPGMGMPQGAPSMGSAASPGNAAYPGGQNSQGIAQLIAQMRAQQQQQQQVGQLGTGQ